MAHIIIAMGSPVPSPTSCPLFCFAIPLARPVTTIRPSPLRLLCSVPAVMTKLILYLSAVAALGTTVNGRAFWQPRATATVKMAAEGNPPAPTLPPKMSELRKRADAVVLVAPDNTCGYISGLPGAAYFCGKGATCAFIPATAPAPGAVACFVGEDVAVRVTCFDAVAVSSSSRCDNGCLVCCSLPRPYSTRSEWNVHDSTNTTFPYQ